MISINFILAIVLAYLIGSIPTSVWIGRVFYGIDVRTKGSGNAGATNTIRVLGYKAGIPVLIFDIFKGWFAVFIAVFFYDKTSGLPDFLDLKIILSIAAVIGHVFPVYVGFKGGKGIATLLGVGIALFPQAAWIVVLIFIIVLIISGYVSLSSMIAAISLPFIEYFLLGHNQHYSLIILSIAVAVFVPITHRKNIKRLINKEESKFSIRKKKN